MFLFKPNTDISNQLVEDVFRDLFTIDENKVLHPTKEFDICEGFICRPYMVLESSVVENYIKRNYPEDKIDTLLEIVNKSIPFVGFINKVMMKLEQLRIKNTYSDNTYGIMIALDPKDLNDNPPPIADNYPDLVYIPGVNREHVYLVKSKEGNESFVPSFPYVSYAYGFMLKLKQFYKELGYDKEFTIEHLNLYKINNPNALCLGSCHLIPDSLFEYGTPLGIPGLFETYRYVKTDELEMVILRKNHKLINEIFQYRLEGESNFNKLVGPSEFSKIVNKIKEEVDFDFIDAELHSERNEEYIFFVNYYNGPFIKEVGRRCIDLVLDKFMDDYYFDKLTNDRSQFVAVDIWDLAEKLLEFVVNQDHYRESMSGITIGTAYNCINEYIRKSKHLEIITKFLGGFKRLVMCSHMGGKYLPVELQTFETGNEFHKNILTPNPEEYEKHKDSYEKQAIILDRVYLKDTLMKLTGQDGIVRYVPAMVGYVSDDTDFVFNFDEKYTEAMNEQMVYLCSDGTIGKAFTDGTPTGRVFSVPLKTLKENHEEVHYHFMGSSANVSIGIYPSYVDFSLTKIYTSEELPSAV